MPRTETDSGAARSARQVVQDTTQERPCSDLMNMNAGPGHWMLGELGKEACGNEIDLSADSSRGFSPLFPPRGVGSEPPLRPALCRCPVRTRSKDEKRNKETTRKRGKRRKG
eukprot:scaffold470_cov257-Pinguiococcus_pyrenoidosus.AAC.17